MKCSRCPKDSIASQKYCRDCRQAYDRERYAKRRNQWINSKGASCVTCGRIDNLEFDHRDTQEKSYDISKLWTKPQSVIIAELDKCDLLCADCHKTKSAEEHSVEHGGGKAGRNGCGCTLCRAQKAAYMKNYHATHVRSRNIRE